jgi:competence protein ComEC
MGALTEKLRAMPLMRALAPLAAGILVGTFVSLPLYVWAAAAVVCGVVAGLGQRLGRRGWIASLYVGLAILFFGSALARAHTPRQVIPRGERIWMEMVLTGEPVVRDGRRGASAQGIAGRWRPEQGEWQAAGEKLLVGIDTVWRLEPGARIVFRGYVNPVSDSAATSYGRLMRARGFTGRTYITRYSQPIVAPGKAGSPALWAARLQSGATERLRRLNSNRDAIAVAAAMTTGDRSSITPSLRESYSRTGASHLLAVSGLHVGIVFLAINTLLYLLPLARGGHIVRNIVAIGAIMFYAALTGGSPSAVRAAVMFTGAQIALAASRTRSPANIMCGTAVVMLAVRPGLLFDISFQLSFLAVAAIMAWFGPLYALVRSRFRILNALWSTLILGITASLATMPLVSHTFGVFAPAGIVPGGVAIATAYLVIVFSLVWITFPVAAFEPVFRWLVGGPAWRQTRVVELSAGVPGVAVEWTMPGWMVIATYGTMTALTMWFHSKPHRTTSTIPGTGTGDAPFILPR